MYGKSSWQRFAPHQSSIDEPYRSHARRDYARILHSPAFRRLQGKAQLFASAESDFFRNRLTHSLEVAQIGKSIAARLNAVEPALKGKAKQINLDVVEAACLAHDLGHPPFGHQGESVLDGLMRDHGGFEGNAQTLRIVTRLEKRSRETEDESGIDADGFDKRRGLNLTARTIMAILKYPKKINYKRRKGDGIQKGYYLDDEETFRWAAANASGIENTATSRVIECDIMDIADDIAYSTYDLEDALKAGFLTPAAMLAPSGEVVDEVAERVRRSTQDDTFTAVDVRDILHSIFSEAASFSPEPELTDDPELRWRMQFFVAMEGSRQLGGNGYFRAQFTSDLIGRFIHGVQFVQRTPLSASGAQLEAGTRREVEVLKHFTFVALIKSTRVVVAQFRADDIVSTIFTAVERSCDTHTPLMPDDYRRIWHRIDEQKRKRVICDFIASMTDRYALEFFGRIRSERPQSIFKPL